MDRLPVVRSLNYGLDLVPARLVLSTTPGADADRPWRANRTTVSQGQG